MGIIGGLALEAAAGGAGAAAGGFSFGSLIGPALGLAGGLFGDQTSASSQAATNAMMLQMQQQNEQWQTQMSNTAMQRRVEDLKAAGLNPLLATGTQGAAMPGFQQPQLGNPGAAFGQLGQQVSSAVQLQQMQSQIDLNKAQAQKAQADAVYTGGAQTELTGQQAALAKVQQGVATATAQFISGAQTDQARAAAQLNDKERARIQQQIESGDIAAQVKLLGAQTTAQGALAYMDRAIGLFNNMGAIEKQYGMQFFIQQLGTQVQLLKLQVPEAQAVANYYSTKMGQLSFAQKQVESGINTGLNVFKAFKPGLSGPGSSGYSGADSFNTGGPVWPVNP